MFKIRHYHVSDAKCLAVLQGIEEIFSSKVKGPKQQIVNIRDVSIVGFFSLISGIIVLNAQSVICGRSFLEVAVEFCSLLL